jgi:hypothetical protein
MNEFRSEEAIVVLREHDVAGTRAAIARETEILQSISQRVFVVRGTPEVLGRLSNMENVAASSASALAPAEMRGLSAAERQWAEAWNLRRAKKKSRPGEGLAWDAPGFSPPDRPD